MCKAHN